MLPGYALAPVLSGPPAPPSRPTGGRDGDGAIRTPARSVVHPDRASAAWRQVACAVRSSFRFSFAPGFIGGQNWPVCLCGGREYPADCLSPPPPRRGTGRKRREGFAVLALRPALLRVPLAAMPPRQGMPQPTHLAVAAPRRTSYGHAGPTAGLVKLPSPLSASGSLRPFA